MNQKHPEDEAHPVNEDKHGKPVDNHVAVAVCELRDNTRNLQVVCHWHESGRIGFWAKGPEITHEHLKVAEENNYRLDHATSRQKDGKKRGYAEFVPNEE